MIHHTTIGSEARGALLGLSAAALFGLSAPVAKLLLGSISPVLLAGVLYLGGAAGLFLHRLLTPPTSEAQLHRADVPKLAAVALTGGIAAPVLMLFGLSRVSGLTGSLLLNLEAPFTALLALFVFHEYLGRNGVLASVLIVLGAALLGFQPGPLRADAAGVLLLTAACACWALDNNWTQQLSLRDPFAIVRVKALIAGVVNTALGVTLDRATLPDAPHLAAALVLGSASYGASIVLDAYALRFVGAAREAAYFATAPFVGALASLLLLGDKLRWHDALAMAVLAIGVGFLLRDRHSHVHEHGPLVHEHLHVHDPHHAHAHEPDDPPGEPHSHAHRHAPLVHEHRHVSDLHHRHKH